ncbi:MAG: LuxR family transcriptional regulator [Leptolyngbya sp. SIO3F4]|nr:LuxR family transcriptional regulator [Leptolyngbya sp. SIO3F4]
MTHNDFEEALESLTPAQKKVLWPFLAYQSDEEIAAYLNCTPANVRAHLTKICKKFGFTNDEGEYYSYRYDLVEVFIKHQQEKVSSQWREKLLASQPEEPEFPGRPLAVDSQYYLVRPPAEQRALKILKPGALVRIRGPRKTGKTSLLYRTLYEAREKGCQTAAIKLYRAGDGILEDAQRFLQWFCIQVSDGVGLTPSLEKYWSELRGDASSCSQYLQSYILSQLEQPLVIGIDEADRLFEHPQTAKIFFGLVRGWSEEAKTSKLWQYFRQIVVYASEVYIEFDLNQSPFNVGTPIRLLPFKVQQVKELAWCYGFKTFTEAQAQALIELVGGHPHLLQLALYHLYDNWSFEQILATAASQTGIYSNHLQTLSDTLIAHSHLSSAFQIVIDARGNPVTLEAKSAKQLEGLGLIIREDTESRVSCQLYQNYFEAHPTLIRKP